MDISDAIRNAINDSEIDIECPACHQSFDIQLSQVGTTVSCPHCNVDIELKEV